MAQAEQTPATDGSARLIGWAAVVLTALYSLAGIVTRRGMGLDFANFYDAGQKALYGQFADLFDIHAQIAGHDPLSSMSFVSAPLTSLLYAPMAMLPPKMALVMFKIAATACLWAALVLLYRHLRQISGAQGSRFFAVFAISALVFQPFWTIYRVGGQTTPLVLLLLVIAMILHGRGRAVVPAACVIAAVAVKPVLAPGMIFLLVIAEPRLRLWLLGIGAVVAAVSLAWFGLDLHLQLARNILAESGAITEPFYNSNMFTWVEPIWLGLSDYQTLTAMPGPLKTLTSLLRLAVIAALIWRYVQLRRSDVDRAAPRHFALMLVMVIAMVMTPVAWAHYISFLFVPLAFVLAFAAHFPRPARIVALLAVATSLFQHFLVQRLYDKMFGLDSRAELIAIGALKSLPMLLIVALIVIWFRGFADSYRAARWPTPGRRA